MQNKLLHLAEANKLLHDLFCGTVQEADREIEELLNWMREDGASSDEEADMLMALAQQAGPTPKSQTPRSSQKASFPFA